MEAPARCAATVFSATPPTSPTSPLGEMVPVTAMTRWPVSDPRLSLLMSVSVMAKPAEGPPMLAVLMETLAGRT